MNKKFKRNANLFSTWKYFSHTIRIWVRYPLQAKFGLPKYQQFMSYELKKHK